MRLGRTIDDTATKAYNNIANASHAAIGAISQAVDKAQQEIAALSKTVMTKAMIPVYAAINGTSKGIGLIGKGISAVGLGIGMGINAIGQGIQNASNALGNLTPKQDTPEQGDNSPEQDDVTKE